MEGDEIMCRCTGHCCDGFNFGMAKMAKVQMAAKLSTLGKVYFNGLDRNCQNGYIDGPSYRFVADMLIVKDEDVTYQEGDKPYDTYTCKNFNTESRNCMIYDSRPWMCSAYPYGGECKFEGCTMDKCGQ